MDFLGVGPLELLFILLIALIVLGPNDMVKTGRTLGK
jgi:Sec-independent protein translocase protein TatA